MADISSTNSNEQGDNKKVSDQMVDKAAATYKWWNNLATLNKEDAFGMTVAKILIRIVGIILMIILSPIAMIALFIAFLAVI